ncbi:hypothetical protein AB1484_38745 [Parafrankia sp. FMc6]
MLTSHSNIWVTDRPPSQYLQDLADIEGEASLRERLRTCLVEENAYQAALQNDYTAFLQARSETLHRRLMNLIDSTAAPARLTVDSAAKSPPARVDLTADLNFLPEEPVDRDSVD